jgi:hypothetical protein
VGAAQATVSRPLAIPAGRPVLVDGRVEPGEWWDARELAAAPDVRLYLKHDSQFLYVAVVRAQPALFGVNLYIGTDTAADYLNLHASAKLGERRGRGGAWPDWAWWNNDGWAANVARGVTFETRRFLPDTAKEFQIRLARLPGREFTLSVDIETNHGAAPLLAAAPTGAAVHAPARRHPA